MAAQFDMDSFRKNGINYLFDNSIMFTPIFRKETGFTTLGLKIFAEFSTFLNTISRSGDTEEVRFRAAAILRENTIPNHQLIRSFRHDPKQFLLTLYIAYEQSGIDGVHAIHEVFQKSATARWMERYPIEDIYLASLFDYFGLDVGIEFKTAYLRNVTYAPNIPDHLDYTVGYMATHGIIYATLWGKNLAALSRMNIDGICAAFVNSVPIWIDQMEIDLCYEVLICLRIMGRDEELHKVKALLEYIEPLEHPEFGFDVPMQNVRFREQAVMWSAFDNAIDFLEYYHIMLLAGIEPIITKQWES
ncbi:MAG: hypothetical protein P8N72_19190 [Flavimaricola sp.]|nr:hypothetical protein [Flavimaricola sp.]